MLRHVALSIAWALLCVNPTIAYPIPPQTLGALVDTADIVVVAKVRAINRNKDSGNPFASATAELQVLRTIKSDRPVPATLSVPFPSGMICPAPPRYEVGATACVFLNRTKETAGLTTCALSYGVKTLAGLGDETALVARISEYTEIAKIERKSERTRRMIEWLVLCTEAEITRWDGAYELAPGGTLMSMYASESPQWNRAPFTEAQKSRLVSAFLRIPYCRSDGDNCLAQLCLQYGDRSVEEKVVTDTEIAAQRKQNWQALSLIRVLSEARQWAWGVAQERHASTILLSDSKTKDFEFSALVAEYVKKSRGLVGSGLKWK